MYVNKQHTQTHIIKHTQNFPKEIISLFFWKGKSNKKMKNYCCGKKNYYIIIIK